MRGSARLAVRLLPISLFLLLGGCGQRTTVERTYTEGEDQHGDYTETFGTSVSLEGDGPEAELKRAKAFARDRDFSAATAAFERLYRNESHPESVRAEALLRWGEAEGNLLNPGRDLDRAIERLELFGEQFPESEFFDEAQRSLERLRAFRNSQDSDD